MCHVTRLSTILMGMLVGLWSSLYAQDAVVLIDQTRVMAGNITPGDAPGFPATISRSGSYRLASNLVISPPGCDGDSDYCFQRHPGSERLQHRRARRLFRRLTRPDELSGSWFWCGCAGRR